MNAAFAYKRIGDYNKAIALYNSSSTSTAPNRQLNALRTDPKEIAPNKGSTTSA